MRWRRLRGEAAEAAREAEEKRALSPRARWRSGGGVGAGGPVEGARARGGRRSANRTRRCRARRAPAGPRRARRLKAEIFWEKYLEVEAKSGGAMALHYRHSAEACNDGSLDARIRGDGTLSVRAVAYTCACLGEGRPVERDGLWTMEYHAWSGRRRDGAEVDDARELEEGAPWRLRVHGAECRAAELPGAEAWAYRYEEEDRRLVPVTPAGAGGSACPAAVLDELWGSSPYRPRGPGIAVGRTPAARRPWPHGSWVLVVAAPGRAARRVPFVVPREGVVDSVLLSARARRRPVPARFGRNVRSVTDGGDPSEVGDTNRHTVDLKISARAPSVTCREYPVPNDLARDPAGAARPRPRVPRCRTGPSSADAGCCRPRVPGGRGRRSAGPRGLQRRRTGNRIGPSSTSRGSTRRPTRGGCPPTALFTQPHMYQGTRRRVRTPGLPWGNGPTPRYAT